MLTINVGGTEHYDPQTTLFSYPDGVEVQLEHSLVSLSKWESKYNVPFLTDAEKTPEQLLDYVSFMIVTPGIDPATMTKASKENWEEINEYINSSQTATTFGQMPKNGGRGETITSELIYYWMVAFKIPFEVETWHLNRLFALIRICNVKQGPQKKRTPHEIAAMNREENARRLAASGKPG